MTEHIDVPLAMAELYTDLQMMGFVNRTPPTPDEWDHPAGYQVRITHVARTTTIRHRAAPPPPPEPIHSTEGQLRYDRSFGWSETSHTQYCALEEFTGWLAQAGRTIGTSMTM